MGSWLRMPAWQVVADLDGCPVCIAAVSRCRELGGMAFAPGPLNAQDSSFDLLVSFAVLPAALGSCDAVMSLPQGKLGLEPLATGRHAHCNGRDTARRNDTVLQWCIASVNAMHFGTFLCSVSCFRLRLPLAVFWILRAAISRCKQ